MELDHIVYTDIVQICALIAPGKPLAGALCAAPRARPSSF